MEVATPQVNRCSWPRRHRNGEEEEAGLNKEVAGKEKKQKVIEEVLGEENGQEAGGDAAVQTDHSEKSCQEGGQEIRKESRPQGIRFQNQPASYSF